MSAVRQVPGNLDEQCDGEGRSALNTIPSTSEHVELAVSCLGGVSQKKSGSERHAERD